MPSANAACRGHDSRTNALASRSPCRIRHEALRRRDPDEPAQKAGRPSGAHYCLDGSALNAVHNHIE
ncbi:hypothetical protein AGR3A_Cc300028 [Agrobacterium tomkonis CFBP 6623]|uniref:Uncharacterized protein n=1 Tax=Agrobacterium tomkonis CFBP 6623 TaxID=1183432 RepID=A0A1S7PTW8_9HYPH|nr:hypothetical protein AGR3A_Cc300028 [Agrobacterium tomkonis CFBP 6623]